jgi:phosphohistidine phosphatase
MKSTSQTDRLDDFDRPLSVRGRKDASVVGAFLAQHEIAPDLILCSTACRTRVTLALVLPFLRGETAIRMEDGIYLASAAKLTARLKQLDSAARQVMIIAHNPGLQELAVMLSSKDRSADLAAIEDKFPTGAFAQIDLKGSRWSSIEPHSGALIRFVAPGSIEPASDG